MSELLLSEFRETMGHEKPAAQTKVAAHTTLLTN
jgi:hypothetical protein